MHESKQANGFTLIEMLVVMAIIATLLTIVAPRYMHQTERAQEAVLRQDLSLMRDAIDKYYGDTGKYPADLDALVTGKYLRKLPVDPFTGSSGTWVAVMPDDPEQSGVFDVKSGASGKASDGTPYSEW
ncbi:MAG: type II secretion system protein [Pseudomonadota bacterium]|uniref:type II secretion system protein n=1 Tax=Thermithiobacillus tepidarius TaxID=929 RepID=UPI0004901390|nr:prepilin-type N-terminal cleavage/methylation domain-containing protein [Thermithiobacillus tepidarius]